MTMNCNHYDNECNYSFGTITLSDNHYYYSDCHNCSENIERLKGRISQSSKFNYVLKKYDETEENITNEIVEDFIKQRNSGKHTKSAIKNNQ